MELRIPFEEIPNVVSMYKALKDDIDEFEKLLRRRYKGNKLTKPYNQTYVIPPAIFEKLIPLFQKYRLDYIALQPNKLVRLDFDVITPAVIVELQEKYFIYDYCTKSELEFQIEILNEMYNIVKTNPIQPSNTKRFYLHIYPHDEDLFTVLKVYKELINLKNITEIYYCNREKFDIQVVGKDKNEIERVETFLKTLKPKILLTYTR